MNKRPINDDTDRTDSSDSDSEQASDITVATQFKNKSHLNIDAGGGNMYHKKTETCV